MNEPRPKSRQAGGVLIALGLMVGAVAGVMLGEPSAGLLLGGAIGGSVALLLWWRGG
ncbi:MAG TPA: hypothetical protein VF628_03150 [Allosphingosinicella sp.]